MPERKAALYSEEDDEQTAVEEALIELESGQGRSFGEFSAHFASRNGIS